MNILTKIKLRIFQWKYSMLILSKEYEKYISYINLKTLQVHISVNDILISLEEWKDFEGFTKCIDSFYNKEFVLYAFDSYLKFHDSEYEYISFEEYIKSLKRASI